MYKPSSEKLVDIENVKIGLTIYGLNVTFLNVPGFVEFKYK